MQTAQSKIGDDGHGNFAIILAETSIVSPQNNEGRSQSNMWTCIGKGIHERLTARIVGYDRAAKIGVEDGLRNTIRSAVAGDRSAKSVNACRPRCSYVYRS